MRERLRRTCPLSLFLLLMPVQDVPQRNLVYFGLINHEGGRVIHENTERRRIQNFKQFFQRSIRINSDQVAAAKLDCVGS